MAVAGKSRRGIIHLAAAQVGSNVVITITDDGQDIDPATIHLPTSPTRFRHG